MKSIYLCALSLLMLLSTCKDDSATGPADDFFIPNISNQWDSSRDNSKFFFNPEKRDVNESTFTGSEQGEGFNDEFSGKFKNYYIEFTFSGGKDANVKYVGKFIKGSNPLRIEVQGTNNVKLVLIQRLNN